MRNGAKDLFLSALNETRTRLGKSIEAMAIDAGCPLSSMADALAGKDGRNFAGHWLLAQGPEFVQLHNQIIDERLGLTPGSKRLAKAKAIGELVQRLFEEAV